MQILHTKDIARVCQGLTLSCTPQDSVLRKTLGTKEADVTGGGKNCLTVCVV